MLAERMFKTLLIVFCVVCLYIIMGRVDCNFLDTRLGGLYDRPLYFENYPCQKLPDYLDSFYMFRLTYHLLELLYTPIYQRDRADFPEIMLHHLMTWSLIFFSYNLNFIPIGAAVMLLHDVTDLAVSIFKLTVDITPVYVMIPAYVLMVTSWAYVRIWFFPTKVIGRLYEECYSMGECKNAPYNLLNMLFAYLSCLWCLHVFWFYLMVKGMVRRLLMKKGFEEVAMAGHANLDHSQKEE